MSSDVPTDDELPESSDALTPYCPHLLTCRTIWYDPITHPDAPFGLGGVYSHMEATDGRSFPLIFNRIFVYFQLSGQAGDYRLRLRLVKIESAAYSELEEVEVQLGDHGEPREFPLPRLCTISGHDFAEEYAFEMNQVPFPEIGLYEYQLWLDDNEEPIARERVIAREWVNEE